ncbi:sigma-70 family RNA polymerase sigma factor [Pedobacter sp. HDW13]|uniref:RNA polymerase sigma factor n=1 Tax=Pedobacter sp. HDW13 TaxID=2714940 RepID=UPI00140CD948|nr:sigma-70 family RNA polymerase sigma factor [Pedobacter sp. HDW13]QIL39381.1 sigma-70 family RNA polymerase sigma factor [Pedobacter sp. HDW13]
MICLKEFEYIYIRHWEKLYAFCFRMTRDESLSQNFVQDIFTDLWARKTEVNIVSIENYLFRAAKNQILKEYRRKKTDTTIMEDNFENYLIDNVGTLETELMDQLYGLLQRLPEKRKEILVMSKIQEMDIDEIAKVLNLSKQTVKNQLTSALKQLRFHTNETSGLIMPFGIYLLILLKHSLTI